MKTSDEERFEYIASLEKGWLDGYGEVIDTKAIARAWIFINLTGCTDHAIFPREDGGVQLEWVTPERTMVSVEFYPNAVHDTMGEVFVFDD